MLASAFGREVRRRGNYGGGSDLTRLTRLWFAMADEYSLYEAKAKLSSLVRQVREGRTVVITVHGVPAAELRPIDASAVPQTLEERLNELEARGVILKGRRGSRAAAFPVGDTKRGALKRFLEERE